MSSEAEKERVRGASDIVEVVSRFVTLKLAGKNLKGLCPFHNEKTPSFIVTPDRQTFKCFGCGAGGDVFEFLMRREGLSFPEALEQLAQRAGISLTRGNSEAESQESQERRQVLAVMQWATERFQQALRSQTAGVRGQRYLGQRKISAEMVERFQLGYAPDGWDNILRAGARDHYSEEILELAGLVIFHEAKKKRYDRFRDRLIFPIWDSQGRPVAFGGRVLGNQEPKYLNSPETPIFQKGELLYGLHLAKETVRQQQRLILVEGYMDVLACHSIGVGETVASLGTALTPKQAQLIKRYVSSVLLLYDTDEAGVNAAFRGFEILLQAGIAVKAVRLPGAKDPDEFIRKHGADAFRTCLDQAVSMVEYVLDEACAHHDSKSIEGKLAIVQRVGKIIRQYSTDGIEQAEYIHFVAERLHLLDRQVITELERMRPDVSRGSLAIKKAVLPNEQSEYQTPLRKSAPLPQEEEWILATLLRFPLLIETIRAELQVDYFAEPHYRALAEAMLGMPAVDPEREESWLDPWVKTLPLALAERVPWLLTKDIKEGDPNQVLRDCMNRLEIEHLQMQINRLQVEIQTVEKQGDLETLKQLAQEKIVLAQRLKQLGVIWRGSAKSEK